MPSFDTIYYILPGFILGLTVHEFSHALAAKLLGDEYAQSQGRLSLNPFAHLSALGTLAILFFHFGWAKPVQVNMYNFKKPRRDFLLVSLAGPFSNLLLGGLLIFLIRLLPIHSIDVYSFFVWSAYANWVLMVLNLLPLPPLDGSRIWPFLFPKLRLVAGRFSILWIVLLVIALQLNVLDVLFTGIFNLIKKFAGPG